jgi:methyltransferase (TIGR00027 family)
MRMVSKSSVGVDNSSNRTQWPPVTTAASVSTWCWRRVRGRIRRSMSTSAASVQRPGFAIHDRFVRRAYRFFDEFSSPPRISGIRQIVILAAGLDSRAYRSPWPKNTVIYEVDLPSVLSFKAGVFSQLGGSRA